MNTIPEIIEDIRAGRMVILVDDENRENEDLECRFPMLLDQPSHAIHSTARPPPIQARH